MDPLLKELLNGFGRAAVRAGVGAIDSFLQDAQNVVDDAGGRIRKARVRAKKISDRARTQR